MKKTFCLGALLLAHGVTMAQSNEPARADLNYNYAELRFVDVDNGGDGLRLNGSFDLGNNWIIVGGLTSVDFSRNVDVDIFEIGAGYVWNYRSDWDLIATGLYVDASADGPGGSADESGFRISGGTRGFLTPDVELRATVNHINIDDSDTYVELAGDYYFSPQLSAGISVELAGDFDLFSVGVRWFFR